MSYWHKQLPDKALYPQLLWDKPENKLHAGKLLIIGGNAHSFSIPALAYTISNNTGIGVAKVLLPDALKKAVGPVLENGEYAPSTHSGSFSKLSLGDWLEFGSWADGVLLPGDFGRNSETAITLEEFLSRYYGPVTITQDALDYFTSNPLKLIERPNSYIVTSFAQLQKIGTSSKFPHVFTYDMPLNNMIDCLHTFTTMYPCAIVLKHNGTFFVAYDGEVSTTQTDPAENIWRVATAATISVWTIHNPGKIFEAITSAIFEINSK